MRAGIASVLDAVPDGAALLDADGVLLHVSPALSALLGRAPSALTARPAIELFPARLRGAVEVALRGVARTRDAGTVENYDGWLLRGPQGQERPVDVRLVHLADPDAIALLVRHRGRVVELERDLARQRALLEAVSEICGAGTWEWDLPTGQVILDDRGYELIGMKPRKDPLTREMFAEVVDPDGRAEALADARRAIAERDKRPMETRVVRPDGAAVELAFNLVPESPRDTLRFVGALAPVREVGAVEVGVARPPVSDTELERRQAPEAPLSGREIEVLQLAADGLGVEAIASRLILSPATVKTHFQRAYGKLDVRDRAAAVASAMRLGLIY